MFKLRVMADAIVTNGFDMLRMVLLHASWKRSSKQPLQFSIVIFIFKKLLS